MATGVPKYRIAGEMMECDGREDLLELEDVEEYGVSEQSDISEVSMMGWLLLDRDNRIQKEAV